MQLKKHLIRRLLNSTHLSGIFLFVGLTACGPQGQSPPSPQPKAQVGPTHQTAPPPIATRPKTAPINAPTAQAPADAQTPHAPQSSNTVKALGFQELAKLGFQLPSQSQGDVLPPQPGSKVQGKTVKGGPNQDSNWTAFTLVLFHRQNGGYEVLTQKRAIKPVGTIETPGGHLTGGQTWREGARAELEQEAGIQVKNQDLKYLQGGFPGISKKSGNLYGNANFFVVFEGAKPKTANNSAEVDKTYGHQWIDLQTLYTDVKTEQSKLGALNHGNYYSFFRSHLIKFTEEVLKNKFN